MSTVVSPSTSLSNPSETTDLAQALVFLVALFYQKGDKDAATTILKELNS